MWSAEGTTQGDPLSMGIYALGTLPLVRIAQAEATQAWFADDARAGDKLVKLRAWLASLCENGPRFPALPRQCDKDLAGCERAIAQHCRSTAPFQDTSIQITTDGRHLLGAPIGTKQCTSDFISQKVDDHEWSREIDTFADIVCIHHTRCAKRKCRRHCMHSLTPCVHNLLSRKGKQVGVPSASV